MKLSKKYLCCFLAAMMFCIIVSGGCGGGSSSNNSTNNARNVSYTALEGKWIGSNGSGTGKNEKYTNGQTIPVTVELVEYSISNIQYDESSGTGTADLSLKEVVTNSEYNFRTNRDWQGGFDTFEMKSAGKNSWNFSLTYDDGAESITFTLESENKGVMKNVGTMWNEDDVSDKNTYDITCDVTKQ